MRNALKSKRRNCRNVGERKDQLIDTIVAEVERVFGEDPGFEGTSDQYVWLESTYGVSEDDDVKWQLACESTFEIDAEGIYQPDPENPDDGDVVAFLADEAGLLAFLENLLTKYRSSDATWPR